MKLPIEPSIFGITLNLHLILEYLAYFIAFRYYLYLRRNTYDPISRTNRLSIIIGALIGAFLGSRIMGFLEFPRFQFTFTTLLQLINLKTIMGGLFGGLLGVELAKKWIGEKNSSGDLFTLPIILGIIIGRIGCFFSGINEFTYGKETMSFLGMDLGDGKFRHPLVLYELLFLAILFFILGKLLKGKLYKSGLIFKYFMIWYFGFRFMIEFLKPNKFFILNLSSIQWLCILCFLYYIKTIFALLTPFKHAYKKI